MTARPSRCSAAPDEPGRPYRQIQIPRTARQMPLLPPVPVGAGVAVGVDAGCCADVAGEACDAAGSGAVAPVVERAATGIADGVGCATAEAEGVAPLRARGLGVDLGSCTAPPGFWPAIAGRCTCGATANTTAAAVAVVATAIVATGCGRISRPMARSQVPASASMMRAGTGSEPARRP